MDMSGRTVLVTGAGRGSIGAETARILAGWGADVVVTTRASDPAIPATVWHPLDLADAASVDRFAAWYGERPLHVLVNNAGVHLDLRAKWHEPTRTADGHEIHWRTNYLGTAHLTNLLLPSLVASPGARVVNVVSKLHARAHNEHLFGPIEPYHSWTAYGASKLALIHHAFELDRRYSAVRGYALHPGEVYSTIADKGLANAPVLARMRKALAPLERRVLMSTTEGAQTTVHCASAPGLAGGRYFRHCAPAEPSPEAADRAVSARLWDRTAAWIAAQPSAS